MIDVDELIASYGDGDLTRYVACADYFLVHDNRAAAAVALDRAFGLAPNDRDLARQRTAILDELAVREHGLTWRYIPAGTFLMGSPDGEPDERPVHPRTLGAFWITDAPITWTRYCDLVGWSPPPEGRPTTGPADLDAFAIHATGVRIRHQYCESRNQQAVDWRDNAGMPELGPSSGASGAASRYDRKPMVGVSLEEAELLATRLTAVGPATFALPTEAQWEKAARGGLVGARYAWGDEPPTRARCDFERMGDFQLLDPRTFPANGYGLHGMCGGLAEWTADVYDALAYHRAVGGDFSPAAPPDPERVLRGGAWTDCAEAVTVSYRMSLGRRRAPTPTIGLRLVRTVSA